MPDADTNVFPVRKVRRKSKMGAKDQGAEATSGRWLVIPRTLCFVTHGRDVLLMKRAAHKRVFPNRYNGVGGHIERDEDPTTSVIREVHEETGLRVKNTRLHGVINIDAEQDTGVLLFVYTAEATSRNFVNGDEGTLEWIPLDAAHKKDLVEDLPILLRRVFNPEVFSAHSSYDDQDQLIMKFFAGDDPT
jgi:8-oxo-dGTP diphosphatase